MILLTGGLGFIGSHCAVELLNSGLDIIIVDNLSNSKLEVIEHIKTITNKNFIFYQIDLLMYDELELIFMNHKITSVIHLAGLKAVAESVVFPLRYYQHNLSISINLLNLMEKYNVKKLIFSSSATVYGDQSSPVVETMSIGQNISNPYGKTKFMIEEILKDLKGWCIVILRYFNPVGAHKSYLIGENPNNAPNNLMPIILQVVSGKRSVLEVFGNCIRDFIHVMDLANAHLIVMKKLSTPGHYIYNIGTGKGTSVLSLIETFEKVNQIKLNRISAPPRSGDICISYANIQKFSEEFAWSPKYTIEDICRDSYKFLFS